MGGTEGQLFAGKYRVERVLGQGGMGVVVAARHIVLDEVVAIKFLRPEALQSAEAVARFEREARAAVKIRSEHVARVTDVGRFENGAPYMVMELLRGQDLAALLHEQGLLSLPEVADYLLQAGEAIAEAHGLGIVHRDLKPSNLFLTQRTDGSSCVKVLDFGISKLTAASASADPVLTGTLAVLGSPLYMSPEQLMSSRNVDLRTDIWSLGVICYELLTGKLPFEGETLPRLCMSINLNAPKPVRAYRQDLPLAVEEMLLRCLDKDPAKRFPNVAALAAELVKYAPPHALLSAERIERLARSAGFPSGAREPSGALEARPSSWRSATSAEPPNPTLMGSSRTSPRPSSSTRRWGVGLTVVLLAGAAAAFAWSRSSTTPELESATQPSLPAPTAPPSMRAAPSAALLPEPPIVSPLPAEPDPAPAATPLAAPSTLPSAVVVQPTSVPTAGGRPASTSTAVVKHPARVNPTPAATDCSVPYFYDARGNKVFKKACL